MRGFFLITLAIMGSPTVAQSRFGTVAVVYYTKDKIIVAADSRSTASEPGFMMVDDWVCKIATPHGKMIFVSSGFFSWHQAAGDPVPVQSFSNVDEIYPAYETAARLYPSNRLLGAAMEWGKLASSHAESLRLSHPEEIARDLQKEKGTLTRALFGGLADDGSLQLRMAVIEPQSATDPRVGFTTSEAGCIKNYCAIGETDITQEFTTLASERARKEAKEWRPPDGSKPADYDILRTMRLVELTIKYHLSDAGGSDVGGPIDAVEMDKNGSVRWFAAKKNCRQD
jgi:hypothetical protein